MRIFISYFWGAGLIFLKFDRLDRSSSLVFFANICYTFAVGMSFDYKNRIDSLWFTEVEEGKLSAVLLPNLEFYCSKGYSKRYLPLALSIYMNPGLGD